MGSTSGLALGLLLLTSGSFAEAASVIAPSRPRRTVYFEPNRGQFAETVRFVGRGLDHRLFLTGTEAVLERGGTVLRLGLVNARPPGVVAGQDDLPGRSHYLQGRDPAGWRTAIPHFGRVAYERVYPGIDVVYHGADGTLEYDFVVAPRADPARIRLRVTGARRVRLAPEGHLVLETEGDDVIQRPPVAFQEKDGVRRPVACRYRRHGRREFSFEVGPYDRRLPLVIDPQLLFSTYLGPPPSPTTDSFSGRGEAAGVATDAAGNIYVVGRTFATNFPSMSPVQPANAGCFDVFVTKFDPSGANVLYSTYLGGGPGSPCFQPTDLGHDFGQAIAVDGAGNAYLSGSTRSPSFPVVNAAQATLRGVRDAFVAKLTADGSSLVYSTYLGGDLDDAGFGIAIDGEGHAFVAGTAGPGTGAFVTKLAPSGSAFVWSSHLDGIADDWARAVAVDGEGHPYVAGVTRSPDFPTAGAIQAVLRGSSDAFLAKLHKADGSLVYSTYLGGQMAEEGAGVAVDGAGNAYVTGYTTSDDFPTLAAGQPVRSGGEDAFVAKVALAGGSLVYSTYLGGSGDDRGNAIAVDAAGTVVVGGQTSSTGLATAGAFQPERPIATYTNALDGFVARLDAAGRRTFVSYMGGSFIDYVNAVALDGAGNAVVAGTVESGDFPTVMNPFATPPNLRIGAFVAKIGETAGPVLSVSDAEVVEGQSGTTNVVVTISLAPAAAQTVTLTYQTVEGTAIWHDYQAVGGTLSFPPGLTSATVTVPVVGDTHPERDEVLAVRIRDVRNAAVGKVEGRVTIRDDDPPTLQIHDAVVQEGAAANAALRLSLSDPTTETVSVAYTTANGTAVAGQDYVATSGVVTFGPGRTLHSLHVPILADAVTEGTEGFQVLLSNPVGATLVRNEAFVTIQPPPSPASGIPMYRAYNPSTDYHFFTTDQASKDFAVSIGFSDESNPIPFYVWNVQQPGTTPLFRLYNPNLGRHYYTGGAGNRDFLVAIGMVYEKDEGHFYPLDTIPPPPGTTELFRLYNNNSGTHLFTADAAQKDGILQLFPGTWVQHESVGFVLTSP